MYSYRQLTNRLALALLKAWVLFVDYKDLALAADDLAIFRAAFYAG